MARKTIRKGLMGQAGGWNETTFNNFKEKAIEENDKLKQNDEWWSELKEELEFMASEMSQEFMGESRFEGMPMGQVQDSLDLINVMGIDIAQSYAKTIIEFRGPSQDLQSYHLIDRLNRRTLQLTNIVNIDFVEFIQVLIEFIKSSEYYGELNEVKYIDPDGLIIDDRDIEFIESGKWIKDEYGVEKLSRRILSNISRWGNHYELYKNGLMDCVKLLEIFLLKSYTGEYGELQARDIVCKDYFFDTIGTVKETFAVNVRSIKAIEDKINELDIKYDKIYAEYDKYTEDMDSQDFQKALIAMKTITPAVASDPIIIKLRKYQTDLKQITTDLDGYKTKKNKKKYKLLDGTDETEFIDKEQIRELWKEVYSPESINSFKIDNLRQGDRFTWKLELKKWKQSFKLILVSMLVNRNDYKFYKTGLLNKGNFDKDIYKTYEQFQVKLAVFYKKILKHLIGFETVEEYHNANPDTYKYKKKLDFRFMDIINCIEEELEKIKDYVHPRNNDLNDSDSDSDSDSVWDDDFEQSIFPPTRHVHLYDDKLGIDLDEDSEDEFERIGQEYIEHIQTVEGKRDLRDYADALVSIQEDMNEFPKKLTSAPLNLLKNIGRQVDIKQDTGETIVNNLIIEVFKKEDGDSEPGYIYRIAISGLEVKNIQGDIDNERIYKYEKEDALRGYGGYLEVIDFSVDDPSLHNIIYKQTYLHDHEEEGDGDTVYFTSFTDFKMMGDTRIRQNLLVQSGDVIDVEPGVAVEVEYSDSDMVYEFDIENVNLFRLGAIANIKYKIEKKYTEYEEKTGYLLETFNKFKDLNDAGESTYHMEYSKDRRGNQNLHPILEERGLGGREYMEDMFKKMTTYIPDKKINMKELNYLKGTGLDLPKHKKNIWPERIGYLETIMEEDKEFISEKKPYGRNSDDKLVEEEFSEEGKEKNIEDFYKKRRIGNSRSLQRDWYKKQGVHNMISSKRNDDEEFRNIDSIPINLLEDNPVFNQETVKSRLKKSLRNKYGLRSRGKFPGQRLSIKDQLRNEKYTKRRNRGRDIALQTDRMRDMRESRSRMESTRLDEELLGQSRLIDGRTPVQVMNLDEHLRPFQRRSFAETDNLRRDIDRGRNTREMRMRRNREEFNRGNQ
jgi:hypothetical protein